MNEQRQADLIVYGIDWLITVDADTTRHPRCGARREGRQLRRDRQERGDLKRLARGERPATHGARSSRRASIDNHLHSSFQLARGLADESNAQAFLFEHMYPYEVATGTEDDDHVSASLAAVELLRHGVTCFIEPGNYHPDATVRAVMAAGMRMVLAVSCFDRNKSVTGLHARAHDRDDGTLPREDRGSCSQAYPDAYHGRLAVSASFRGMNNTSDELILALKAIAERHGAMLQTHACYSYFTRDSSIVQFGKPEIERLESLGVLDERMLLLHSGWLEPHEIAILARRKPTAGVLPVVVAAQRLRQSRRRPCIRS